MLFVANVTRFPSVKNFEHQLTFDEDKADYTYGATFSLTHPV